MNIFFLNRDPRLAAVDHCDKHVCKMILESTQMLCAAHWHFLLLDNDKKISDFKRVKDAKAWLEDNIDKKLQPPWKLTHYNHPCTVWARESLSNYVWLAELGLELCNEYTRRYKKTHLTARNLKWLRKNIPTSISENYFTNVPLCVPEDCKVEDNPVESYRRYYAKHKSRFAKWKYTIVPDWYEVATREMDNRIRDTNHVW